MNSELIDSLTPDEAQIVLRNFLEVEGSAMQRLAAQAAGYGVIADFTLSSILPFFEWLVPQLKRIPIEPPGDIPEWIRKEHEKRHGWLEFDKSSKVLVFRAGYYLGESFARSVQGLTWGTGHPDYADKNAPVVVGFTDGQELPPLRVARVMLRRMLSEGGGVHVSKAINHWLSKAPGGATEIR